MAEGGGTERIRTFDAFWLFYLGEHSKPATRALHLVGTTLAFAFIVFAAVLRAPVLLLAALGVGYAFAFVGHFFAEHNRPATFRYPMWSFAADWKMWFFALTGRLGPELTRAGVG
jgi:hypothetical protein